MKTPFDHDLNKVYEAFRQDHAHLRQVLMDSLTPCSEQRKQLYLFDCIRELIGGTVMRNRITKLATAAVIAIAVVVGIRGFNGTTAWGEVIKAFKGADDIHVVIKITFSDGQVRESRSWLKNRVMFRCEDPEQTIIDNGKGRLILNPDGKTFQLSDSQFSFEDYMGSYFFVLPLLRGEETEWPVETKLLEETDRGLRVYEIKEHFFIDELLIITTAWIDPRSHLPVRITGKQINTETEETRKTFESTYDYQPISMDLFSLKLPPGYTEKPAERNRVFSGKVIDGKGESVAGAEVVTSSEDIRGRTGEQGEFVIELHPDKSSSLRFPMVVRAFKSDDPNRLAWTLLRNPRHEREPDNDGKTTFERGSSVDIYLVDEKELLEFIPADPGTMIFEDEKSSRPSDVRDIMLQMGPASVITGRVTDQEGKPVANAVVWIKRMEISVGENEIDIRDLRHTAKEREIMPSLDREIAKEVERKAFAVTDSNGRYEIGHLPDVWYGVWLGVKANGYVSEVREIFQSEGVDFSMFRADITIRGTVIDNHGRPLVGREVQVDVDSDDNRYFDVEDVITDSQGRFELTGVPAVDDLVLEIRTDEKPRDWKWNDLTRDQAFIYYLMIVKPVKLEPDRKEYFVEIVPHRPDITLEIEVKDSKGTPLAGVPSGVCSPGFTEREWYISKLVGKTDANGIYTIPEVPRIESLKVWIGVPGTNTFQDWETMRELSKELKEAINEFRTKYAPTIVTVELEEDKKDYKVFVTL